jgi:hypothetical protein
MAHSWRIHGSTHNLPEYNEHTRLYAPSNFEGNKYRTATSKSLKEDEELLKAGFEYVTERDEIKICRKRK